MLNKADLLDADAMARLQDTVAGRRPARREGRARAARAGSTRPSCSASAPPRRTISTARPSHHDAMDGAHEHDDFESFVVALPEIDAPDALVAGLRDGRRAA